MWNTVAWFQIIKVVQLTSFQGLTRRYQELISLSISLIKLVLIYAIRSLLYVLHYSRLIFVAGAGRQWKIVCRGHDHRKEAEKFLRILFFSCCKSRVYSWTSTVVDCQACIVLEGVSVYWKISRETVFSDTVQSLQVATSMNPRVCPQQLPFRPRNVRLTEILGYKASPGISSLLWDDSNAAWFADNFNMKNPYISSTAALRNMFFAFTSTLLYSSRKSSVLCSGARWQPSGTPD